jgi:ABC-2 type transport system permease protein
MRYLRLFAVQLRASALLVLQYRVDFVVNAILSIFWTATSIVPLVVLFQRRTTVAGWTWPEALLVVGWFTVLKGVLEGAIQPSLVNLVEQIRKGTLDFLLLKPADAQFLVSTSRFELRKVTDVMGGLAILGYAMSRLHRFPPPRAVAESVVLFAGASTILYSLFVLVACLAFIVVRVDNLSYLFASVYDAARWPASVFRGALAVLFTFVIPLAVMTTFPSLALLGRMSLVPFVASLAGACVFAAVARFAWTRAIRSYTSAGG